MWKANKFINILLWALSLISVAVCTYVFLNAGSMIKDNPATWKPMEPMFVWMYVLLALALLLAVVLPIPNMISNPKSAKGVLLAVVCFGCLLGISYTLASTDALPFPPGHAPIDTKTLKFSDVNLISIYIMLGLTLASMLLTGIWNFIKTK